MRSTVAAARARLDELTPALNPEMYKRCQQQIAQAESAARVRAATYLKGWYDDVHAPGTAAVEDVCAVRDELRSLVDVLAAGTVTAADGTAQLEALQRRHRGISGQRQRLAGAVDYMTAIADDPVAFIDSQYERFPALPQPDFDF